MPVDDYPQLPGLPELSARAAGDEFAHAVAQVNIAASKDDLPTSPAPPHDRGREDDPPSHGPVSPPGHAATPRGAPPIPRRPPRHHQGQDPQRRRQDPRLCRDVNMALAENTERSSRASSPAVGAPPAC
ncbi:hypothetical protein QJS66_14395 [Kocuria rhizophila]|nr:hypothetical protein QJS66_14395 [Kocuria rhizophila]